VGTQRTGNKSDVVSVWAQMAVLANCIAVKCVCFPSFA
jgi:hypothetical protein